MQQLNSRISNPDEIPTPTHTFVRSASSSRFKLDLNLSFTLPLYDLFVSAGPAGTYTYLILHLVWQVSGYSNLALFKQQI